MRHRFLTHPVVLSLAAMLPATLTLPAGSQLYGAQLQAQGDIVSYRAWRAE